MQKVKKSIPNIRSLQKEISLLQEENQRLRKEVSEIGGENYNTKAALNDIIDNSISFRRNSALTTKEAIAVIQEKLVQNKKANDDLRVSEGYYHNIISRHQMYTENRLWYLLRVVIEGPSIPKMSNQHPLKLEDGPFDDRGTSFIK